MTPLNAHHPGEDPNMRTRTHQLLYRAGRTKTIAVAIGVIVFSAALAGCGGNGKPDSSATSRPNPTTTDTPHSTPSTTKTPGAAGSTTTVQGPSGPPADYPAAQPTPPSLAGAYPTGTTVNLVTVIKTLTTYEDWVWSHPNPALVANYELRSGNVYAGEVKDVTAFQQQNLHASPTPAEIDFVKVTQPAKPQPAQANGQPSKINGYTWFVGGIVTVVYNLEPIPMLDANGSVSGQAFNPSHPGPTAYVISLVQGPNGQFRINDSNQINPPGGIKALEQGQ